MANKDYQTINERQSYVTKSGGEWEDRVRDFLNESFNRSGFNLNVIRGKSIPKNSSLWEKLVIPVGGPGSNKKIWGDIDLVVIDKKQNPVAVISCKTSLHGRFSETLFYAIVLKELIEDLKFVFTSPDKGRQQKKGEWQSEWGSEEKPTKDRLLGSHYLDGIYIENKNTKIGGMIKSLDDLPKDLIKWVTEKNK